MTRQEKQYLPRPDDGALARFSRDGYNRVDGDILKSALNHVDRGKSVMFLTACSYMLRPIIQVWKQGVPVSQSVSQVQWLLKPAPRWPARIDGHPGQGRRDAPKEAVA